MSCIPIELSTINKLSGNNDTFPLCTEQAVENFNKSITVMPALLGTCKKPAKHFNMMGKLNNFTIFSIIQDKLFLLIGLILKMK